MEIDRNRLTHMSDPCLYYQHLRQDACLRSSELRSFCRSDALMRKAAISIAVTLLVLAGCGRNHDAAIAALHKDVVELTLENATLKARLDQNEKQRAATASELAKVSERVRQLEVEALMGASGPVPRAPKTPATAPAAVPDAARSERRGGFTDFGSGKSSAAPSRVATVPTAASSTQARVLVMNNVGSSWNDVAKASDFYDAQRVMTSKCGRDWPADARMFNHCMETQAEALAVLKQGRPFGADEKSWNASRVRCARSWPDDYRMRLHCEGKP